MAHVTFLWHMHQPYYVDPATRTATMPWVRLHSVKGYLDMITVLEDFPGVRVNFNLTPVLVLQIREMVDGTIRDQWLDLSRRPAAELDEREKFALLENFFKIHWENLVRPFPRYWELLHKRGLTFYRDDVRRGLRYFSTQEFLDLQTWFNLAWCGYTAERLYPELAELKRKGRNFTEAEKNRVLDVHLEIMGLVLGKYRAAEERGQAELTTTPFFHPILPLVYDTQLAERSLPGREFPRRFTWPQDAAAQLALAVEQHTEVFGRAPRGLWPSEGSIAPEIIPLMRQNGFEYFCSDEENLFNSLKHDPAFRGATVDHLELFQGWRVRHDGAEINAVFREKPLSDFIGFMAAKNEPAQAAAHLLAHLRHIADLIPNDTGLIPLILDGENAWETFADGGEGFLRALYAGIEADAGRLRSATMEEYFRAHPPVRETTTLHTGSWICSNFDIWIGDPEENRAWDLLGETRAWLDTRIAAGTLAPEQQARALREIYAAEGSDWFWWYGPDFSTDCDLLFDELFRSHLRSVYSICGAVPPAAIEQAITESRRATLYHAPEAFISPRIDGAHASFFEWSGAGSYVAGIENGAMFRSDRILSKIHFGSDERAFYLCIEFAQRRPLSLVVHFHEPANVTVRSGLLAEPGRYALSVARGESAVECAAALGDMLDVEIPLSTLGLAPGMRIGFQVRVVVDGIERECYPEHCPIQFTLLGGEWELEHWIV